MKFRVLVLGGGFGGRRGGCVVMWERTSMLVRVAFWGSTIFSPRGWVLLVWMDWDRDLE